jgi:hypothetical protein
MDKGAPWLKNFSLTGLTQAHHHDHYSYNEGLAK